MHDLTSFHGGYLTFDTFTMIVCGLFIIAGTGLLSSLLLVVVSRENNTVTLLHQKRWICLVKREYGYDSLWSFPLISSFSVMIPNLLLIRVGCICNPMVTYIDVTNYLIRHQLLLLATI